MGSGGRTQRSEIRHGSIPQRTPRLRFHHPEWDPGVYTQTNQLCSPQIPGTTECRGPAHVTQPGNNGKIRGKPKA